MTATWELLDEADPTSGWSADLPHGMELDAYELRDGRCFGSLTVHGCVIKRVQAPSREEAKVRAVALAFEVIDEMRRAVEGLR